MKSIGLRPPSVSGNKNMFHCFNRFRYMADLVQRPIDVPPSEIKKQRVSIELQQQAGHGGI